MLRHSNFHYLLRLCTSFASEIARRKHSLSDCHCTTFGIWNLSPIVCFQKLSKKRSKDFQHLFAFCKLLKVSYIGCMTESNRPTQGGPIKTAPVPDITSKMHDAEILLAHPVSWAPVQLWEIHTEVQCIQKGGETDLCSLKAAAVTLEMRISSRATQLT